MFRHGLPLAAATLITVVFIASCGNAQPTTPTPELADTPRRHEACTHAVDRKHAYNDTRR